MPLPWTVTAGPELQSPKEPGTPQTPAQGTRKSNSMKVPSIHHGDTLKPSLSSLKRTFLRNSLPASTHKPKEDQGLIRRSSRLLRSLRRALDEGLAAGHPQVPAVTEKPSSVTDGISRQASTGMGPEDLELQEGRVSYNSMRTERAGAESRYPDTPKSCLLHQFFQYLAREIQYTHWANRKNQAQLSDLLGAIRLTTREVGFEPRSARPFTTWPLEQTHPNY